MPVDFADRRAQDGRERLMGGHIVMTEDERRAVESISGSSGLADALDGRITRPLQRALEFREKSEKAIAGLVSQCRAEGWTWTEIGAELGVSKQAALKRYGTRRQADPPRDLPPTLEGLDS